MHMVAPPDGLPNAILLGKTALRGSVGGVAGADVITATTDVSGWASGVYVLAIYSDHGVWIKSLVVL